MPLFTFQDGLLLVDLFLTILLVLNLGGMRKQLDEINQKLELLDWRCPLTRPTFPESCQAQVDNYMSPPSPPSPPAPPPSPAYTAPSTTKAETFVSPPLMAYSEPAVVNVELMGCDPGVSLEQEVPWSLEQVFDNPLTELVRDCAQPQPRSPLLLPAKDYAV